MLLICFWSFFGDTSPEMDTCMVNFKEWIAATEIANLE